MKCTNTSAGFDWEVTNDNLKLVTVSTPDLPVFWLVTGVNKRTFWASAIIISPGISTNLFYSGNNYSKTLNNQIMSKIRNCNQNLIKLVISYPVKFLVLIVLKMIHQHCYTISSENIIAISFYLRKKIF